MAITPEISAVITTCVGILVSVFTGYLTHKVKQRDEDFIRYRREREEREEAEIRRREEEDLSRDKLTLGMARSMLLDNYYRCVDKKYYSVTERDVYHELYEAYVGAGGNGVIHELAEKIVELPTEPPKKDKNMGDGS